MNAENSTPGTASTRRRLPAWLWPVGLAVVVILPLYLWQVFMAAFEFSKFNTVNRYSAKPGWSVPDYPTEFPKECVPVYVAARMTPYADAEGMHRFPEFRERGNFWLLDSAKTHMYEAELLKHPRCLQFRLQEMAAVKNPMVLVIYDKAIKSDLLVVRNY